MHEDTDWTRSKLLRHVLLCAEHEGLAELWAGFSRAEAVQTLSTLLEEQKGLVSSTVRRWKAQQKHFARFCQ